MTPVGLCARAEEMLAALETTIVGKRDALHLLLAAILADGHVLIEDVPGVAKTSIARAVAQILGLPFKRVQFTPDLLPADLTGGFVFDQRSATFQFRRGPVFTQLLLADEIAARRQKPVGAAGSDAGAAGHGGRRDAALVQPFLVIATQNPIEMDGTYPLPEAQLDRFLIRLDIGYRASSRSRVLRRRRDARADAVVLPQLFGAELLAMRAMLEDVFVEPSVERCHRDAARRVTSRLPGWLATCEPCADEAESRARCTGRPNIRDARRCEGSGAASAGASAGAAA
jgi:MoxR-like ATPase